MNIFASLQIYLLVYENICREQKPFLHFAIRPSPTSPNFAAGRHRVRAARRRERPATAAARCISAATAALRCDRASSSLRRRQPVRCRYSDRRTRTGGRRGRALPEDWISVFRAARCWARPRPLARSEERRVGKELSVSVDLGGRRIIKKKTTT